MKRFTKIKSGDRIKLAWQQLNGENTWDDYSISCVERARPEFYETMQALAAHLLEVCEITTTNPVEVNGVSLAYGGEAETMMVTLTAKIKLENSTTPLCINTPCKPCGLLHENDTGENVLYADAVDAIQEVINEAETYLDGDRAQGELFGGNAELTETAGTELKRDLGVSMTVTRNGGDPQEVGSYAEAAEAILKR